MTVGNSALLLLINRSTTWTQLSEDRMEICDHNHEYFQWHTIARMDNFEWNMQVAICCRAPVLKHIL